MFPSENRHIFPVGRILLSCRTVSLPKRHALSLTRRITHVWTGTQGTNRDRAGFSRAALCPRNTGI